MSHEIFLKEPVKRTKKNRFNLSHDVKMSTKFGRLTPIMCQEVLPGDHFNVKSENLIRFAPMLSPVMHKITAQVHYFFVPNRIVWPEWELFITGGKDGTANPPIPRISSAQTAMGNPDSNVAGSLMDYLGYPVGTPIKREDFNLLALAAYQRIYYDYYVDPNLDNTEFRPLTPGNTNSLGTMLTGAYGKIRTRAWRKDYFTSALPWAQRGPIVNLPLNEADSQVFINRDREDDGLIALETEGNLPDGYANVQYKKNDKFLDNALYAELESSSTTIADLRKSISLQSFFEKLARGGHRYFEVLQRMFGVRNLDARLDRAEFIGGQTQDVVVSEVLQTSETGTTPLADMAGHALSVSSGKNNSYFVPEHGHIIGILSVMPNAAYDQGLPRQFSRSDRFDFYWQQFAHIGEQEILNKELYYDASDGENDLPFGYTPRYAEYRFNLNRVAGSFRDSLSYWQMGRKFGNRPKLNTQFVYTDPDADYWRHIFNVLDGEEDYLWLHTYNHIRAKRPIPRFGVPSI